MRRRIAAGTALLMMALAAPAAAAPGKVDLDVLSSRADQVSGGDALVRVDAPPGLQTKLRVLRNGTDVTWTFEPDGARSSASSTACGSAPTS